MSKPNPVLMEMPPHVIKKIILNGDVSTRFKLRKCSKSLHPIIDKLPLHLHSVTLSIIGLSIRFEFFADSWSSITYSHHPAGCSVRTSEDRPAQIFENQDLIALSTRDIFTFLRNPNLSIGKFSVVVRCNYPVPMVSEFCRRFLEKFHENIHEFNVTLSCETFDIHFHDEQDEVEHFLPYLKPGKLKTIRLDKCENDNRPLRRIDRIVEMEQWKQAEHLEITHIADMVRVENLKHFKSISIGVPGLQGFQIVELVQHFTNTFNYERCEIICTFLDRELLRDHLDVNVSLDSRIKYEKILTTPVENIKISVSVQRFTLEFRTINTNELQ